MASVALHREVGPGSMHTYARSIAVLFLISLIAGGFGEAYVPSRLIVPGDAAATVTNINALGKLFRLGFAGFLLESACETVLLILLYVLLRPVDRNLAALATLFELIGLILYAVAEMFYFAPSLLLGSAGYLKSFSPDQLNALALLSLRLFALGAGIFTMYYGWAWIIRGYLMFRSGYIPKILGVLMTIDGFGFVARNFALILAPQFPSAKLLFLFFPGVLALIGWLLVKGVDVTKWQARAAESGSL